MTVIPSNASEILKQWADVHGVRTTPTLQTVVDGYPRQVWLDAAGEEVIESYSITHMAHGTPLATGDADFECGASGPFLLEVGISSSYHIAKFFSLTKAGARPVSSSQRNAAPATPPLPVSVAADAIQARFLQGEVLNGEVLTDEAETTGTASSAPPSIDIGAVINRALEAAGLLRR